MENKPFLLLFFCFSLCAQEIKMSYTPPPPPPEYKALPVSINALIYHNNPNRGNLNPIASFLLLEENNYLIEPNQAFNTILNQYHETINNPLNYYVSNNGTIAQDTPLEISCQRKRLLFIKQLLRNGADPNLLPSPPTAIKNNCSSLLDKVCLSAFATPRDFSAYFSCAQLLLEHGADPNRGCYRNYGKTHTSALANVVFNALFDFGDGTDFNHPEVPEEDRQWEHTKYQQSKKLAALLISYGADIDRAKRETVAYFCCPLPKKDLFRNLVLSFFDELRPLVWASFSKGQNIALALKARQRGIYI